MDIDKEPKTNSNFKRPKDVKQNEHDKDKNKVKALQNSMRDERINQKIQTRKNKLNDYLNKKRGLTDSDTNTPIEKTINISNLSMLADKNLYIIPPRICVLVPLNS